MSSLCKKKKNIYTKYCRGMETHCSSVESQWLRLTGALSDQPDTTNDHRASHLHQFESWWLSMRCCSEPPQKIWSSKEGKKEKKVKFHCCSWRRRWWLSPWVRRVSAVMAQLCYQRVSLLLVCVTGEKVEPRAEPKSTQAFMPEQCSPWLQDRHAQLFLFSCPSTLEWWRKKNHSCCDGEKTVSSSATVKVFLLLTEQVDIRIRSERSAFCGHYLP